MTQIKMARADQEDFDTVLHFLQNLEEKIEDLEEPEDIGQWVIDQMIAVGPRWRRVVWGYETLARNAADLSLSYLDWKPEIKAALEMYEQAQASKI